MNKSFKDFLKSQEAGMSAMSTAGVIGLHMVTGPIVGFVFGYFLDNFFGLHPWGKILFLLIGIAAGFLNVYRDTKQLLSRMAKDDAKQKIQQDAQKKA